MRRLQKLAVIIGATALVALAGCSGSEGSDESPDTTATSGAAGITVVATEFSFEPAEIEVAADTAIELTLENKGVVEHDFSIDELGIKIVAQPGETVTETITIPAGTYEVHCTIAGHHESGMVGSLTAG